MIDGHPRWSEVGSAVGSSRPHRRSWLHAAAASAALPWLTPLSQVLAQDRASAPRRVVATRSLIVLWLAGQVS